MGDGPGPSFPLVTAFAPISMPVRARTPRVRLLILPGVHARTVALKPAMRHPRPRPRPDRHPRPRPRPDRHPRPPRPDRRPRRGPRRRPPAITRATTPPTACATMADPAPNTTYVGSAPTATTAALVQGSCHVVLHAARVRMGLSHFHMGPRISGPMSTTTRPHGGILAVLVQELPVEEGCTSTKLMLGLGFLTPL